MSALNWQDIALIAKDLGVKYYDLLAAQWALESGYGKYESGKNNFFGLKGKGTVKRTREVYNGKEVFIDDEFMDFDTPKDCIKYIADRWYKDYQGYQGVDRAANREAAAIELEKQGYATDPEYSKLLITLMKENAPITAATTKDTPSKGIKLRDAAKYYEEKPHQVEAWDRLQATLTADQIKTFETLYRGSLETPGKSSSEFPLKVPYYYQRNSTTGHGERMCQSSCISMAIEYIFPEVIDGDDDSWLLEVFKYGDTVSQIAQMKALKANGIENVKFLMDGSEKDLIRILDKGYPIPVGILHKGSVGSPSGGGHWILLIGYNEKYFYVHDPFGELDVINGGYVKTDPNDGKNQKYTRTNLMKRWLIASKSDGWYYDFSQARLV